MAKSCKIEDCQCKNGKKCRCTEVKKEKNVVIVIQMD